MSTNYFFFLNDSLRLAMISTWAPLGSR